jgi:hypothetical protein
MQVGVKGLGDGELVVLVVEAAAAAVAGTAQKTPEISEH